MQVRSFFGMVWTKSLIAVGLTEKGWKGFGDGISQPEKHQKFYWKSREEARSSQIMGAEERW